MEPFGWNFEAVRKHQSDSWNNILNRVRIYSNDYREKVRFYTNLYRASAGILSVMQTADGWMQQATFKSWTTRMLSLWDAMPSGILLESESGMESDCSRVVIQMGKIAVGYV